MSREKKDSRQEGLKYGVTVALSLGGLLYNDLNQIQSSGNRDDDQAKGGLWNSSSIGQERYEELSLPKCPNESFTSDFSPSSVVNRGKDFSLSARKTGFSSNDNKDALVSNEISEEYKCVKNGGGESEQEFQRLRNMVKILEEKEKSLEIQLLEYYGLKEQESAVIELQNRLKLNNMETKLFNLKILSLQEDKRKLEEQVADQARITLELEAAKAQIKLLNKKLRSEAEQNRKNIIALQERVKKIQEEENKAVATDNVEAKLQKLNYLEDVAEELRKMNSTLRLENSELAQKLEYVQLIATSAMDDDEATTLKKECHHLRQENEELTKKVELLQANRCSDAEEMVYLRWVNACLRYELRNYQPSPGRTIARELSKTLSPESEEKAKQLILHYGSTEGMDGKGRYPTEYDSHRLSSSQISDVTDSGEYSADISSLKQTKSKGFGKLMRLLQGKDSNIHYQVPSGERTTYIEDMVGKCPLDSPGCHSGFSTVTGANGIITRSTSRGSRYSLDLQRTSDEGSLCIFRSIDSILEDNTIPMQPDKLAHASENVEKSELVKYAEALKASRNKPLKRRTASSSF
ncbi:hypothetical protein Leryth_005147 [Lithospermum erythrorhizon]|nr:hypothetical protein Leryth_005147 [Lithospermum erythrorhizon]